ncbi:hypothetical protein J4Q44_G00180450 [Coregonus suidteri]|uniref:Uncharacterized protein n=1 Tax=Coregonus suidteri TaxID=861788 RepID=A0AAN8QV11_9TELE
MSCFILRVSAQPSGTLAKVSKTHYIYEDPGSQKHWGIFLPRQEATLTGRVCPRMERFMNSTAM